MIDKYKKSQILIWKVFFYCSGFHNIIETYNLVSNAVKVVYLKCKMLALKYHEVYAINVYRFNCSLLSRKLMLHVRINKNKTCALSDDSISKRFLIYVYSSMYMMYCHVM